MNDRRKQIENYNETGGLDWKTYLEKFEDHEQLFEDRNVEQDDIIRLDDDFEI